MTEESAVTSSWESSIRERRSPYGRGEPRLPRLLLVDDDALHRRVAARSLGAQFDVTSAANGEEALARFAPGAFEVVVTDYQMPAMTGIELLEQIRLLEPRVRRVLMSGINIPGIAGYIGSGIVEHFLLKPVDLNTVLPPLLGLQRQSADEN
jgi:CheY-like chemotaxis protein